MGLITYTDKQAIGSQPSIPAENKITDSDMNEIKTAINDTTTYSSIETIIGVWEDGKTLYRKTIDFGTLPNASIKNVAHNISNLYRVVKIGGYAYSSDTGNCIPIPYVSNSNINQGITLYSNATNVCIKTEVNHTLFNECYITLEYTKSS